MKCVASYLTTFESYLHLFSNACAGQNRNHTITKMLMGLTKTKHFDVINQYYPRRRHSFLFCNRNFTVVKKAIKRKDKEKQTKLIRASKKEKTVDVVNFKN